MAVLPEMPSFDLSGRRALVTGAGRGIGLAAAAALAASGAHVVLAARSADELDAGVSEIANAGGSAEALVLDVLDTQQVKLAIGHQPPFDILVNNAGTNRPGPFIDVTEEDFDVIFDLNVRAAFFVAQAVVDRLLQEGQAASIINISSQMGKVGAPNRTVYCASKHALEGLTKAMAVELGQTGIRVNSLCPTFVETPMTRPFFTDPGFKASVLDKIKLGRLATPSDIMGAIVFLASDASAMMTGTALVVDGGWTAG